MNKTISITLGGTIFHIEEDAYQKLSAYLKDIAARFDGTEEKNDIMSDIEANIAEKFSAKITPAKAAIDLADVDELIAILGTTADFDEELKDEKRFTSSSKGRSGLKKLYRNTDDQIVAGVCSGIAAYFGMQPLVIRLLFFISIFFGGVGVIIYLILWIVVPEAKTNTQKLEMAGDPVTLERIEKAVKENINELKRPENTERIKSSFRRLIEFPFIVLRAIFRGVGRFLAALGPIVSGLVGGVMLLASIAGICFFSFLLCVAVFNIQNPWLISDIPLNTVIDQPLFKLGLLGAYLTIVIPGLFVLLSGLSFMRRKNSFSLPLVSVLIGLWMLSAVSAASIAFRYAPDIQAKVSEFNAQQQTVKNYDLKDFSGIKAQDNISVSVTRGEAFAISVSGPKEAINRFKAEISEGQLVLTRDFEAGRICLFCFGNESLKASITMPHLASAQLNDAGYMEANGFKEENMKIVLNDASRGDFKVDAKKLDITITDASRLTLTHLTPKYNQTLSAFVRDASRLTADEFEIKDATITLQDASRAELSVSGKLIAKLRDASRLTYGGTQDASIQARDASRAIDRDAPEEDKNPQTSEDFPAIPERSAY